VEAPVSGRDCDPSVSSYQAISAGKLIIRVKLYDVLWVSLVNLGEVGVNKLGDGLRECDNHRKRDVEVL